jgi:protein gp37
MQKSRIEWTEQTANPIIGCSKCSAACDHCYALTMARRVAGMKGQVGDDYRRVLTPNRKEWNGQTVFNPEVLRQIIRRKKPTTYFIGSMCDWHHESVPPDWKDDILATAYLSPQHRFMVLTKRPGAQKKYMTARRLAEVAGAAARMMDDGDSAYDSVMNDVWPPENLALGVSVWDQESADHAIPLLLQTPAAKRFVSAEPLLGPIDFRYLQPGEPPTEINALEGTYGLIRPHGGTCDKLDFVVVGGETGHKARPMHPDWARQMRDQCAAAGVPFMFKQWGAWWPHDQGQWLSEAEKYVHPDLPDDDHYFIGKKAAGRLLDGVEHNGGIQW